MNIILIRHAKSSWDENLNDHERPISLRGIIDAKLVFEKCSNILPKATLLLSSSSKRTVQTAKIFSIETKIQFESIILKEELYTFDSNELEKIIKKNLVENLIIFGHNSAITDFVNKFGNYYIENVPTCGVVMIKFEDSNTISPNKGVIFKIIFPRDLR